MQTPQRGLMRRPMPATAAPMTKPTSGYNCEYGVAEMVSELMNGATTFHKLHLKVQGVGSYAAHKTLDDLYSSMHGFADTLAESYQGAACCILQYNEVAPKTLNSVEDGIALIKTLKAMVCTLQDNMPYSEIVNDLDLIKSEFNSAMYKLTYLK